MSRFRILLMQNYMQECSHMSLLTVAESHCGFADTEYYLFSVQR